MSVTVRQAVEEFVQRLGYGTPTKPVLSVHMEHDWVTIVWVNLAEGHDPCADRIEIKDI